MADGMATELVALAIADPERARQRLRVALSEAGGSRRLAARVLGVPERTFYRLIERLDMTTELATTGMSR